jgi:hypothetical protein
MEVWNVRWVGIPTRQYEAMVVFMRDVLGLEINFQDQTTVEFRTVKGDPAAPSPCHSRSDCG